MKNLARFMIRTLSSSNDSSKQEQQQFIRINNLQSGESLRTFEVNSPSASILLNNSKLNVLPDSHRYYLFYSNDLIIQNSYFNYFGAKGREIHLINSTFTGSEVNIYSYKARRILSIDTCLFLVDGLILKDWEDDANNKDNISITIYMKNTTVYMNSSSSKNIALTFSYSMNSYNSSYQNVVLEARENNFICLVENCQFIDFSDNNYISNANFNLTLHSNYLKDVSINLNQHYKWLNSSNISILGNNFTMTNKFDKRNNNLINGVFDNVYNEFKFINNTIFNFTGHDVIIGTKFSISKRFTEILQIN